MAECILGGIGGLIVKSGVIHFTNANFASVALDGIPQMVIATIQNYTVSSVIASIKNSGVTARFIANNGISLGSIMSTNTGFQINLDGAMTTDINYFAIM